MAFGKRGIINFIHQNSIETQENVEEEFQRIIEKKKRRLKEANAELENLDHELIQVEQELANTSNDCNKRLKKEQEVLYSYENERSVLKKGISKREQMIETINKCMDKIGISYAKVDSSTKYRNQKCFSFPTIVFGGESSRIYFNSIDFSGLTFNVSGFVPEFPGHKDLLKFETNFPGFLKLARDNFLKYKENEEEDDDERSMLEATAVVKKK